MSSDGQEGQLTSGQPESSDAKVFAKATAPVPSGHPRFARWQQAMWALTGVSLLITILLLLGYSVMTTEKLSDWIISRNSADPAFVTTSLGIFTHTLVRLLSILVGAALAFGGLAVSFFAHEREISLGVGQASSSTTTGPSGLKANLSTYAPGVVGVFVGAVIIVTAVLTPGNFKIQSETKSIVPSSPSRNNVGASPVCNDPNAEPIAKKQAGC